MAKFCLECGASVEGKKFCPECGTALEQGASVATSATVEAPPAASDEEEREVWMGKRSSQLAPINVRSHRYTLTTERLKVDTGMLRKSAEVLDLWRVKDVSVKKGMTQRTRKCGDVEVTSADASTPKVTLTWVQNPDEVAERIRQTARVARKRHGVATQERF